MTNKEQKLMTNKWLLVVKEYELLKNNASKHFKTLAASPPISLNFAS